MTIVNISATTEDGSPVEVDVDTLEVGVGTVQVLVITARPDGAVVITLAGEYGPGELTPHSDDLRVIGGRVVDTYREINR